VSDPTVYDLPLPDGTDAEITGDDYEVEVDGLGTVVAHANQAASRLIERLQRPVYRAIVRAVGEELQEAENMLWAVLVSRYIDNAEGEALNFLGGRVGESRESQDDPGYRVRIRARVVINRSRGGPEDLLLLVRTLGGHGRVTNTGNASVRLDVPERPANAATRAQLPGLAGETVSAGVRVHVSIATSAVPFVLDSVSGGVDAPGLLDSVSGGVDAPGTLADDRMT
jgi:hypothetical protein